MVEGIGNGIALGLLLQVVITNFGSNVEAFLDVAIFQRVEHLIVMISPNTGEIVGLQF